MKDIVPYTKDEKDLLEKTVGVDITDTIPNARDHVAQFVVAKDMTWCGLDGKYTGWWKGGTANGRGTWRMKSGWWRIDAVWMNGYMHGTGRKMLLIGNELLEGKWNNDRAEENGSVKVYAKQTGKKIVRTLSKGERI